MRKVYYLLCAILAAATLCAQPAPSQNAVSLSEEELNGQCGENLYWNYSDGTLTITGSGEMFNYTTSITGVAPWNKFRNTITQVSLPAGLTSIGSYAFDNCNALSTMTIPDSVTMIGNYAFRNCSTAYAIILGKRLININNYAFSGCKKLTNIFVKNQTQPILGGSSCFSSVPTPATIYVPCGQKSAYQNAAYWSKFTIREMSAYAICTTSDNSNTGYVEVSTECESNVATITAQPKVGYIFTHWNDGNTDNPRTITLTQDTLFIAYFTKTYSGVCGDNLIWTYNNGTLTITGSGDPYPYSSNTMPWYLLKDSITTILLPEDLTSISSYMFANCKNIQDLAIPNNVKTIGNSAFYSCRSLTSIVIPDSVKTIGNRAFRDVPLRSLTIGKNVNNIEDYAFYHYNTYLTSIIVNAVVPPAIQENTINPSTDASIFVECGLSSTYQEALYWNHFRIFEIAPYQIRLSTNGHGDAFIENSNCGLITITATPNIGYSFTQWNDGNTDNPRTIILRQDTAFTALFNLAYSGTCGADLQWAYSDGTLDITGTGDMSYYNSPSNVPWAAFRDSIAAIQLPDELTSICNYAFYYHTALTHISIGKNVVTIGNNAFNYCKALTHIDIQADTPPAIASSSFSNVPTYTPIHVPCGQTEAYRYATYWDRFSNFYEGNFDINAQSTSTTAGYVAINATCDNNTATLTAIANTGYIFTQWNDGVTDNPRAITLTQDTSFTASFEVGLSGQCGDNLYYTYYEGILRISGSGDMYDYNSNTNRAPWYLVRDSITMISISPNATSIGEYAFRQCDSIIDIIIPNKVTRIGRNAFYSCRSLSSAIIGQSVTSIEDYAFNGCRQLSNIIIPKSVTYIGQNAFVGTQWWTNQADGQIYVNDILCGYKGSLKRDTTIVVKAGTRSISPYALSNSRIVSLVLPNSVTTIGRNLPSSLISLKIESAEPPTIDTLTFSKNDYSMTTVYVPCGAVSKYASAKYWSNFSNIQEQISHSITINTNNKNYGYGIVSQTECGSNDITITAIVKSDKYQFVQWNDGNTDNPRTLTLTRDTAFTAMFDNVYEYSGTCGDDLVWDYDPLRKSLTVTGSGEMYDYAKASETPWYSLQKSITAVSFPAGLTHVGAYAFSGCSFITPSVTIPDSVVSIGAYAFSGCSGISSFSIGDNIIYIGNNAFSSTGWYNNQPNGAIYIGKVLYIYKGSVSSGTDIAIKEGTISISPYAFSSKAYSRSLSITIPSSIVNIGEYAFKDCRYLTSITSYAEVPPTCGENVFYNVPTSTPLYVPETAVDAYRTTSPWSDFSDIRVICVPKYYDVTATACDMDYYDWNGVIYTQNGTYTQTLANIYGCDSIVNMTLTFKRNDFLYTIDDITETATITGLRNDTITQVVIPETIGCDILYPVVAIADNAFAGNTSVTFVSAEHSVETIGSGAFSGCAALGKLTLGNEMRNIGDNAFSNCRKLIHIYCNATEPPYAETNSFSNYNGYLYVPCSSIETYQTDMVFGSFKFIQCATVPTDLEPIETPSTATSAQKIIRNGQLYILRDNKIYTPTGVEVK